MKVERELSDFSTKKWKLNENKNGNLRNEKRKRNFLAEVETEMERHFPVEKMWIRKFLFSANT
jgi:hypothetical protein